MSVVSVSVKAGGTEVSGRYELLYIDVTNEYNKITNAELNYIDGDLTTGEFEVSDGDLFLPGNDVEIKLRYENDVAEEKTVFKGIVVKQGLQMDENNCTLTIELSDPAVKMTTVRKNAVFKERKDSEVFDKIIKENGLESDVDATSVTYPALVQYYSTDWDFICTRAEANGLLVSVKEGTVSVKKPPAAGGPVMSFEWGKDEIYEFNFEVDARHQVGSVESSAWDTKDQKIVKQSGSTYELKQGNLTSSKLAEAVGAKKGALMSAVSLEASETKALADSVMMKNTMSMLKGRLKVQGTAGIGVGDIIELKGAGDRFSGKTLVTGIRHQVTQGDWFTEIQFGLSAEPFSSAHNIVDTKAAGLLPGVNGLQVGVVIKGHEDPLKENRVEVMLPAIDADDNTIWARLSTLYAGKERGTFFLPEVGDEVIVGFLNDDPRHAVILGSVHSAANPAPLEPDEKHSQKGIVTVAGLKILFNDEKKFISILTSENNIITINEEEKAIEVKDANNNSIILNKDGITLDSGKDVIIKSQGNIKMEATKNVEISGMKVDIT